MNEEFETEDLTNDSFVFYETMEEQVKVLPDDLRLKFLEIIISYGLHETEPQNLQPLELALWIGIKKDIDYSKSRRNEQEENK